MQTNDPSSRLQVRESETLSNTGVWVLDVAERVQVAAGGGVM